VLLVVAATAGEAGAIAEGLGGGRDVPIGPYRAVACGGAVVLQGGIGPGAAGAATATALALGPGAYRGVLCAGVAGGYGQPVGGLVVASAIVPADLGADSPDGWLGVEDLGWAEQRPVAGHHAGELAAALGAACGPILTVSTVTGTARRAQWLATRFAPVAEAMEGAGVAAAAVRFGVPVAELRAISNVVGPRDRSSWDLAAALAALRAGASGVLSAWT
jgi:futalosine hydrolase